MLLNNASNGAPVAGSVEQLSAMPTPQSIPSSSSTMDNIQNLASQNSRLIGDPSIPELSYGTPGQLAEQGRILVTPLARTGTVFQQVHELKFERANILLDRFRTMTGYFPFVVIPPAADAKTLSKERPFLYRAIVAVAEQNPNDQRDQARDIMQYLALHMFQLGEKNLDMLLRVLVLIAWYVNYIFSCYFFRFICTKWINPIHRGHYYAAHRVPAGRIFNILPHPWAPDPQGGFN
jgi:hypothetical protein